MIDFSRLDKVIHEKGRLSIMTLLATRAGKWPFQDLKAELKLSDGNLVTHLRKLEEAGYVISEKVEGIGRPQTFYTLTKEGREAFKGYLKVLEAIVKAGG